ncbi:hypothetical protein UFOVP136_43 [uncultured Caudovirales phage]|uniref:Phage tail lysozyme domain-containing protein n=1 Tax=uncultured Caudovirales phage TaxID=2100421 RepID=A0A6J5LET6_9CAUD|nr:hypothetical protein UFOVP136_43 [uncultured Caudovirales phage]
MAAKSIIEISVDDSKFQKFKSVFDDYKKALEETPEAWSDANSEIGNMVQASQLLRNDAEKRLALLQLATNEESKAEKAAQKAEDERKKATEERKKKDLETIKRWKKLGKTIAGATAQLAKFASIGMGLATGAGALGMGKLTNDASSARFQSMGLGISSGAMQSANINYSSALSNPSANLSAVRDAQQDLSKQKLFLTAGISNYQNKSPEQLLPELMVAAQKMAKQTPQGQLAQIAQANGYTDVFSMEDLTRFKQMSEQEMQAMNAKTAQDNKSLNVNNSTLKSYQDLQKQWDRFGQSMENTWIKGLEPLAPALTRFSEAIGSTFEKFMQADKLEPIINKLADEITKFSEYLTSPEAEQDFDKLKKWVSDTADGLEKFADKIHSALVFFGFADDDGEKKNGDDDSGSLQNVAMMGAAGLGGMALAGMAGGLALPVAALTATGVAATQFGSDAYNNDSPENQEFAQSLVGGIAAFFGDKDALNAQKQIASYTESSDKELKKLKPMTAEEFKKADSDSQKGFIEGLGEKFKTVLSEVWNKTEEVAGGIGNALISTASADEFKGKNDEKGNFVISQLMKKGWSKEQAAGIAANLHEESGYKNDIVGDGGKAYGIGQWHPDRQANFKKVMGKDIRGSSLADQVSFVDWELRNTEKGAGNKLANARSAREAGGIVSKYYERPKDVDGNVRRRGGYAELIAGRYTPEISHSDYKGTPIIIPKGDKDANGKVKDSYALRKPTADQQKSVMFSDQGGAYNSNSSRVQINVNNSTGGSATASAVSL